MTKDRKAVDKAASGKRVKAKKASPQQSGIKFIQSAAEFEKTRIQAIKRSNKIAWSITGAAVFIAVMSVGAVMMLSPLKSVEPFVLKVDNSTGMVEIVTTMKEREASYGEIVDRYWLSQYIQYRESYDWWNVQDYYNAAMLLSAPAEQLKIADFFAGPAAPYKVLKDQVRVKTKIVSISWVGNTAQVRFERHVQPLDKNAEKLAPQRLIATINYRYLSTPQSANDRLVNPLGVQIESYRTDHEG